MTACAYCRAPIRSGIRFCSDRCRGSFHTAERLVGAAILATGFVDAQEVIRQHKDRRAAESASGGAYTAPGMGENGNG